MKNSIFLISAQNIDCGYSLEPPRWGGSNRYPQSMFLSRNKKNNVYPCKPQFYYIKVGLRGSKLYRHVFVMLVCRHIWSVYMEFIWSCRAFSSQFAVGMISYARKTIIQGYFIVITFAGALGRYLNTRPSGPVFKQLPRDPANVNACKTMGDHYTRYCY